MQVLNIVKNIIYIGIFVGLISVFGVAYGAPGGVNNTIPYSAVVSDTNGDLIEEGVYNIRILLYQEEFGGTAIYEEIRNGQEDYTSENGFLCEPVEIIDGKIEVMLGECNPLLREVINNSSLYLELQLGTNIDSPETFDEVFAPRRRIGSTFSAISARQLVADGAGNENTVSIDEIGNLIFETPSGGGNVGIGTASPGTLRLALGSSGAGINDSGAGELSLYTGGVERLQIDENGRIGIGNSSPQVSLDITATDAIRLPRGTIAERPTGANGMIRYNTETFRLEVFSEGEWRELAYTDDIPTPSPITYASGEIDSSFDVGTGFNNRVYTVATQNDDKVLVGGDFTLYQGSNFNHLIRINEDGSPDLSFDTGTGFNNRVYKIAVQSDGRIVAGGMFTSYNGTSSNRVIRLNPDGSRDTSFDVGSGLNNFIYDLVIQDDGRIVAGGDFSNYNGTSSNRVIRLNPDGSRDVSFDVGSGFNGRVRSVDIQDDGKILVGGDFSTYQGVSANYIIRLNSDGSRDTTFDIGSGFDNLTYSVKQKNDGKIIVGGQFSQYNGASHSRLVQLNSNGSIDSSFDVGGSFNDRVMSISVQEDDKIVVGGIFSSFDGSSANRIIRLNTNGSQDSSFDFGVGFDDRVYVTFIRNNGKILAGGDFTTYKSNSSNRIVQIE